MAFDKFSSWISSKTKSQMEKRHIVRFYTLFNRALYYITHSSSLPFFQSIFSPYYEMWTCISWSDNKGTFNFVSIAKKNAAPRSLCIVLPVLQGRNYERAGQHAMSPSLSRPPTRSSSFLFTELIFRVNFWLFRFLHWLLPRFTQCHTHTHKTRHYIPKKFVLIVSFMTESFWMLTSFSRKEE